MTRTASGTTINGIDTEKFFETMDQIKAIPHLGAFKFRTRNVWIDGGHNRTTVENCYGAGEEQPKRDAPFVLDADEPPILLGHDTAPNPVEYLLHALTACVTSSIVYHAAARGIRIQELESHTEGDLDTRGFLGLDNTVPRGFQNIRIRFRIKADVPQEQLEEVIKLGPTFSPVFDTVTRPVNVEVTLKQ